MAISKICFLMQVPLTKHDYQKLGIEELIARGFAVSFLDMTDYYNPEYRSGFQSSDLANNVEVIRVIKMKEVIAYLKENNKNTFYVVYISSFYERSFFMYRVMGRYGIKYAVYAMGAMPFNVAYCKANNKPIAIRVKLAQKIHNAAVSSIYSLPFWLTGIKGPTFELAGGRKIVKRLPPADKRTKVIFGHLPNYDIYLRKREQVESDEQNYFVFLDQYLPFNPDLLIPENRHLRIDADNYYLGLNRFFDYLEKIFKTTVIIAAHPSSQYHLKPDLFGGRQVEKGKTLELIARSRCALTHCCTSMDYALLYKKPIMIFTSDEMDLKMGGVIHGVADVLGVSPINMDDEQYLVMEIPKIDLTAYNAYIADYLKYPGTPDKPYWDIVADNIKMLK